MDNKLSSDFSSKFSKLTLSIYIIKSEDINAFTIPGIIDYNKFLKNPNYETYKNLIRIYNSPYQVHIKDGIIRFNRQSAITVFVYSSLVKKLSKSQLFAVILHEVGHWLHIRYNLFAKLFYYMNQFMTKNGIFISVDLQNLLFSANNITYPGFKTFRLIAIGLMVFSNYKSRTEEYFADNFVKECGYSKDLKDALSIIEYDKVLSDKEMNQFSIKFKAYLLYSISMINSYFTGNHVSHPTTISRMQSLSEGEFLDLSITSIIQDSIKKVCPWIRL